MPCKRHCLFALDKTMHVTLYDTLCRAEFEIVRQRFFAYVTLPKMLTENQRVTR